MDIDSIPKIEMLSVQLKIVEFFYGITTSFSSSKDANPKIGNVSYYGAIEEILEVDYWREFNVVVFKCCWYQEENDLYGLTRVNFNKQHKSSDPMYWLHKYNRSSMLKIYWKR